MQISAPCRFSRLARTLRGAGAIHTNENKPALFVQLLGTAVARIAMRPFWWRIRLIFTREKQNCVSTKYGIGQIRLQTNGSKCRWPRTQESTRMDAMVHCIFHAISCANWASTRNESFPIFNERWPARRMCTDQRISTLSRLGSISVESAAGNRAYIKVDWDEGGGGGGRRVEEQMGLGRRLNRLTCIRIGSYTVPWNLSWLSRSHITAL